MLKLLNVSKKFGSHQVLENLSGSAQSGDFVVIMGPNGTGKTTLFDIISGKIPLDQGSILLDGIDISSMPEQIRATHVARLFQNTYLGACSELTVRENLAMANLKTKSASLKSSATAFPENTVSEFLEPLNLKRFLDTPLGALSGGQRQMIAFIMAILTPPKLLLLDEPTAALDPNSATQLLSFAKTYAETHRVPTLQITLS